jgi:cytochrome c oxidase cbb3-type subunit 4
MNESSFIDINFFRGLATVFTMIAFLGICLWSYSSRRKEDFDQAANLPFVDDELDEKLTKENHVGSDS